MLNELSSNSSARYTAIMNVAKNLATTASMNKELTQSVIDNLTLMMNDIKIVPMQPFAESLLLIAERLRRRKLP